MVIDPLVSSKKYIYGVRLVTLPAGWTWFLFAASREFVKNKEKIVRSMVRVKNMPSADYLKSGLRQPMFYQIEDFLDMINFEKTN